MNRSGEPAVPPAPDRPAESGFYTDDLEFPGSVVPDQCPPRMAYAAAFNGYVPPAPVGSFRYCDLGCGDGATVIALAAACPGAEFTGIDFNPAHIDAARRTAASLKLDNTRFIHSDFSDLGRCELPRFEFIAINGIYGWLEPDPARSVRRFAAAHLVEGGLLYAEYLSMPGKAGVAPLWRLIQSLLPPAHHPDTRERARIGLQLLRGLVDGDAAFLVQNRAAAGAARQYLRRSEDDESAVEHFAHNALASGFRPRYFTEVYDEMAACGLVYAGSTAFALNDPALSIPPGMIPPILALPDERRRELLKDFARNQGLRRDVFIKNNHRDSEAARRFLARTFHCLGRAPRDLLQRRVSGFRNQPIMLSGPVYDAMIAGFDGTARAVADLVIDAPAAEVVAALNRLLASGQYFLCVAPPLADVPEQVPANGIEYAAPVHRWLIQRAVARGSHAQLVSPVTGGVAMTLNLPEACLLHFAVDDGLDRAVAATLERLRDASGTVRLHRGAVRLAELTTGDLEAMLESMLGQRLRNLRRLGIIRPAQT